MVMREGGGPSQLRFLKELGRRRQAFGLAAAFLPLPAALVELPLAPLALAPLPLTGVAAVPPFDATSIRFDSLDLIRAALLR